MIKLYRSISFAKIKIVMMKAKSNFYLEQDQELLGRLIFTMIRGIMNFLKSFWVHRMDQFSMQFLHILKRILK